MQRSRDVGERELERGMDSMIGEMGSRYGAELSEERQIDRRLADVKLRDDLVEAVREIVRCRKLGERFSDEGVEGVTHTVEVAVSPEHVRTRVVVRASQR